MIALAAIFAIAAISISMIPAASAADEPFNTYSDIRAESYMAGTGSSVEYTVFAGSDAANYPTFTAKLTDINGNTVSRVSPSSGTVYNADGYTITITAPNDPGMYTLVVDFTFTNNADEKKTITKTAPLKVVVPVKLSATLVNSSGSITDMDVWFIVNGTVIEESKQSVSIGPNSSREVSYNWVTDGLPSGKHTVTLSGEVGPIRENVEGLDTPMNFYVGQTSYALTEGLLVVVLIVLLLILIIVIRKPVKNVGKPKGRR